MELNIEKTQQLEKLLARPALVTQEDIPFLQNLVEDYPYFQPLYLLLAKAGNGNTEQQSTLTKAALYTNGSILHRVLHQPHLQAVEEIAVVNNPVWNNQQQIAIAAKNTEEVPTTIPTEATPPASIADAPEIENLEPLPHEVILKEPIKEAEKSEGVEAVEPTAVQETKTIPQDFVVPEIENLEPLPNEVIKVCEPTLEVNDEAISPEVEVKEADDQEIFEEIGEVTLTDEHLSKAETEEKSVEETALEENRTEEAEEIEIIEEELIVEPQVDNVADKAEEQNDESLTKANFFAFDPSFETEAAPEEEEEIEEVEELPAPPQPESIAEEVSAKENIISKYDDDKLPFTFLWWLAKTRKDHEQIFRPFASPAKANSPTPDLQQQYIENIFHIQAPFEPGQDVPVPTTESPRKESKIIDSFIKNDPQIKALKPHQINNENKAKRSAEDNYDMVSETLAQIYIEQMLYHKAIDTYQKLSLKFPEKSRYFADLIQSLEKKI
ncbi:hypothetical protein [Pedobacter chitinilyticus]|uniref:Tetratricopeptide repeat protein n=1 Tax=Pedobacter chitinilyticus TaxID=2233776 RepID=A0A3S3PN63_9SPHI|nr:hypothetical protein [Pedobacter chitinilyticus]RWU06365.1 hypothetical protein DPV69_13840 [Pedobacter chitinilyticus]